MKISADQAKAALGCMKANLDIWASGSYAFSLVSQTSRLHLVAAVVLIIGTNQ